MRVGTGPILTFAARSVLVVPAHQPHSLGELGSAMQLVRADEHRSMLGDDLVSFIDGIAAGTWFSRNLRAVLTHAAFMTQARRS